ncbi:hypothetical protein PIB30_036845 [Stylosanthes scabra]|uniref:Uncharacterized protein n=1 Tax=Stylosanthes scabra TaxID=79078 RepID=A0ABU6TEA4_9FABA|nr:hypothetical protein [Stylosanthes scabra]
MPRQRPRHQILDTCQRLEKGENTSALSWRRGSQKLADPTAAVTSERKNKWLAGELQAVCEGACGDNWRRVGASWTRDGKTKAVVRAVTNQSVGRGPKNK